VADITITRIASECFRIITGSGFIGNDIGWILMNIQQGDAPVEVRDITADYACIALWGPKARQVLQSITQSDVSNKSIPYMTAKEIQVGDTVVLAQRVSYIGSSVGSCMSRTIGCFTLGCLFESGRNFGIEIGGYKVLDSLRLEKGYRYFTADATLLETPYAAGLGFCVQLDKGDFIGKEALQKLNKQVFAINFVQLSWKEKNSSLSMVARHLFRW